MNEIIREKVNQAVDILKEYNIDVWLTFARETSAGGDPVLPLIYGHDLTWQSAVLISKNNDRIIILGRFEAEAAHKAGIFDQIIPYDQSIREPLIKTLDYLRPNKIAINYSKNDVLSDGLCYGLYQVLMEYLNSTSYVDKLVSAEQIINSLRSRKTQLEIERIKQAISTTEKIYDQTFKFIKPGLSEIEIAEFMHQQLEILNLAPAWEFENCPTVNAGPDSPVGHVEPSDITVKPGHIVHFDFGIHQNGYCSDIQRVIYIMKNGENSIPEPVSKGFNTVSGAIHKTVSKMKPGLLGKEVDSIAREYVKNAGYPEYMYATGHHIGQLAHDGAGILGPAWERYGETPNFPLEPGHVYAVEPGLKVDGYGYIGLEEDVLVCENIAEFLSTPQTELIIIK